MVFLLPRLCALAVCLLFCNLPSFGQRPKPKTSAPAKPAPIQRLTFTQAQTFLTGEKEGNLNKRMSFDVVTYTLTQLRSGQVLELFYPVAPNQPTKPGSKARVATVPGYGILFESEAIYHDSIRPRHALEDLIPDGRAFVTTVPQLVARLEKRLRLKLDYSRASLRRLDAYVANYRSAHEGATETDAQLFQELTAYYGETLRRACGGDWHLTEERIGKTHVQTEPNLRSHNGSATYSRVIKPWSSILKVLYEEETRSSSISRAFDTDLAAAQ